MSLFTMTREVTPHFVDLVYSALLLSFWRKSALRQFLRSAGISASFLSTWHHDETKRDFLDRLFETLQTSPKGAAVIRSMGRALAEQTVFPDLAGWEDSGSKLLAAQQSVSLLSDYIQSASKREQQESDRLNAQERFRKHQEAVRRAQADLQKLGHRLSELIPTLGTQKAGYDFQDWFFDLLDFSEIASRRPYVHGGRQIDGSLTHDGTTYLIELKFTMSQADAPDIDTFHRKLTSKADNTMGLFLSISGYSAVAIKEASQPHSPMLLLDHTHIYAVLTGASDFRTIIDRVRRHASQTGEAHLPASRFDGA